MTLSGVRLFNYTCVAHAIYVLTITEMRYHQAFPKYFSNDPRHLGYFQTPAVQSGSYFFFVGAGCVSSMAAISNIKEVEEIFHDVLHSFRPSGKFWATKILITIAFIQSVLLE